MAQANDERINGWRDIAAYLARDERTAKRWEKQRGLPVRRIPGEGRANVYVLRHEVEAWLQQGRHMTGYGSGEASEQTEHGFGSIPSPATVAAEVVEAEPDERLTEEIAAALAGPPPERRPFRPSEHLSLMVSLFGLLLLLTASAIRFFHLGPLEAILFASESLQPEHGSRAKDTEADRLYLQGIYLEEQRTSASLEDARDIFEQVIWQDPEYAPSYAGLAKTYLLSREYAMMPDDRAFTRAKEAAEQALALDPNLAEAHAALGFIDFFWFWRSADAEREFRKAMQLDPANALAHHWYGSMLTHQGRYAEALMQLDQAQHLSPTSAAILSSKALALGFGGKKEEGIRILEAIRGAGHETAMVHRNLAYLSLVAPRDTGRFLEEYTRFADLRQDKDSVELLRVGTETFRAKGETAMWEVLLREERRRHPEAAHPTYLMAQAEASLGHEDEAIYELNQLADDRDAHVMGIVVEPAFLALHKDAAFLHIAERVGLLYPTVAAR